MLLCLGALLVIQQTLNQVVTHVLPWVECLIANINVR